MPSCFVEGVQEEEPWEDEEADLEVATRMQRRALLTKTLHEADSSGAAVGAPWEE